MSKNSKGGLDQYGTEWLGRLIFATIRKSVGLKGLTVTELNIFTTPEPESSHCSLNRRVQ